MTVKTTKISGCMKWAFVTCCLMALSACSTSVLGGGKEETLYVPSQQAPLVTRNGGADDKPAQQGSSSTRMIFERLEAIETAIMAGNSENRGIKEQLQRIEPLQQNLGTVNGTVATLSAEIARISDRLTAIENRLDARDTQEQTAIRAEREKNAANQEQARLAEKRAMESKFGIHLTSYRDKQQGIVGWRSTQTGLSPLLDTKHPRVFEQEQPGVGTFLRVVVGPYETMDEATTVCEMIRSRASDQFCRAVAFGGDRLIDE